jgi:acyl-CoA dehydrogenase
MFKEAIDSVLGDHCGPAVIRAIENGAAPTALWNVLEASGFLELMAPEEAAGADLALDAMFPIFVAFGRRAVPVPMAQSIAARALLGELPAPRGMVTLAGHCRRDGGGIVAAHVACGTIADHVLAGLDGELLLLDASRAERTPVGVRGSSVASLRWPSAAVPRPLRGNGHDVAVFSAAIHAAAMAGAMERMFAMTLEYCNDRVQFGKAIGKFQSVQHQLSVMAEHVACAGVAAELAFSGKAKVPGLMAAATAKSRTSMAVPIVAAIAHALHGAVGVTEELDLQLFSRRLHEWRMADGSEAWWNKVVGEGVLATPLTVLDFVKEKVR